MLCLKMPGPFCHLGHDKSGKRYSFTDSCYLIAFGSAVRQAQLFLARQVHAKCSVLGRESTGD